MRPLSVVLIALSLAPVAWAESGHEVIARAQAHNGFAAWRERRTTVRLEGFENGVGASREADIYERTDPRGEHRTRIEMVAPDSVKGTRYLHVSPRGARDGWWTWLPTTRRVLKLGGTAGGLQRDEIFFGSDMSYRELELLVRIQQWTDAEGTAVLEGEDACGADTCLRIAVAPRPTNDEFPCARYRLWYGRDDLLLRRAELHGPDDRLMKTITCRDYFATGRFMTPRSCTIAHVNGSSSTITVREVAYDGGLADELFTVAHLGESS